MVLEGIAPISQEAIYQCLWTDKRQEEPFIPIYATRSAATANAAHHVSAEAAFQVSAWLVRDHLISNIASVSEITKWTP